MPNSEPSVLEPGIVVRVPFPYGDRPVRQHRPALVVAAPEATGGVRLLWVVMITSARNRPWPDDVAIDAEDPRAGLPSPSVVRCRKIATIDVAHAGPVGRVDAETLERVRSAVRGMLET